MDKKIISINEFISKQKIRLHNDDDSEFKIDEEKDYKDKNFELMQKQFELDEIQVLAPKKSEM